MTISKPLKDKAHTFGIVPPIFKEGRWADVKEELGLDSLIPKPRSFSVSAGGKTMEIFISDELVSEEESKSSVPRGFRVITKEEGAFIWRHNQEFRMYLSALRAYSNGGVWTSSLSPKTEESYRIGADGSLTLVEENELPRFPIEERAQCFVNFVDSDHLVALAYNDDGDSQHLAMDGDFSHKELFNVAYIRDTNQPIN
jgi:hypothetical protein